MNAYGSEGLNAHLNRVSALPEYEDSEDEFKSVDELVHSHLKLVVSIAARYSRDSHELEDNVGVGHVALVLAARSYHPRKGSFTTWAAFYIKGEIRNQRCDALGCRRRARTELPSVSSIDAGAPLDEGATDPHEGYTSALKRELSEAVAELPEYQGRIMRARLSGITLAELGERYGVSQQAIRQTSMNGVEKLARQFA